MTFLSPIISPNGIFIPEKIPEFCRNYTETMKSRVRAPVLNAAVVKLSVNALELNLSYL